MPPATVTPSTGKRPLRILCAEDNPQLGDIMLCLFARGGNWVEHCADGASAWSRLKEDPAGFDVLVTDHSMPGLDGLQLVAHAKNAGFRGRIIVHTSGLKAADRSRYEAMGVDAVVVKAARAEELLRAVFGTGVGSV